ncbi:ABC transporter ATP-binding protein [Candidatus Poribacteria bacterium]|nr:ABC transporter ATP-binding protein [Candidatus Poribacteria bacterium]MYB63983.1 ABC transporter ATP-binding protein [Candidatus Poribacteria bacterium]
MAQSDRLCYIHFTMLFELNNVSVTFGTTIALDDLSIEMASGGAIGLLGPNGAGKSTLIKMLLGFVKPTRGSAKVFDMEVETQQVNIRERVGYMPEDDCLIPTMNAVQLVAYAGQLCGMPFRDAMQRAHEVLYYVGVDEERYRSISGYSAGMRQRIKLAQALVHDPKLLLLDEPTNGMDTSGREEMLVLVKDISEDKGIDVLLSSHLLPDVESTCQTVLGLSNGSLAVHGKIDELRKKDVRAFDLKIIGDRDDYIAALQRHQYQTELRPDGHVYVTTETQHNSDGELFFKVAHETGVQLRQLVEVEHSLEDIFADVMYEQ